MQATASEARAADEAALSASRGPRHRCVAICRRGLPAGSVDRRLGAAAIGFLGLSGRRNAPAGGASRTAAGRSGLVANQNREVAEFPDREEGRAARKDHAAEAERLGGSSPPLEHGPLRRSRNTFGNAPRPPCTAGRRRERMGVSVLPRAALTAPPLPRRGCAAASWRWPGALAAGKTATRDCCG